MNTPLEITLDANGGGGTSNVPYRELAIDGFGGERVRVTVRRYPKRTFVAYEDDRDLPDPVGPYASDAEDAYVEVTRVVMKVNNNDEFDIHDALVYAENRILGTILFTSHYAKEIREAWERLLTMPRVTTPAAPRPLASKLKMFIVSSDTNYDLMVHIVNAATAEEAKKIALEDGAWDGCRVTELDPTTPGVIYCE
jgi:hypothetical protein